MIFNSFSFLLFLVLIVATVPFLRLQWRLLALIFVSYLFYAAANPSWLAILLVCTVVDFHLAKWVGTTQKNGVRRLALVFSCSLNLGLLFCFKYAAFAATIINSIFFWLHLDITVPVQPFDLPLGISFFVFESLSYMIDIYANRLPAATRLSDYALFIAFFPHLVAGPIVRAREFLPQIQSHSPLGRLETIQGVELFVLGLFKKVVIADTVGTIVDPLFADGLKLGGLQCWSAAMLFAVQIYCDFSGYTDMARGLARLFGFELGVNFLWPYLSRTIREFWRHWHISLSTWLRDYLYIPLGGNRNGFYRMVAAMFVTWFLGGLWHGAAWHYVAWGLYHGGLVFAGAVLSRRLRWTWDFIGKMGQTAVTFLLVCIGWVLFRAPDLGTAWAMIHSMLKPWHENFFSNSSIFSFIILAVLALLHVMTKRLYRGDAHVSILIRLPYGMRLTVVSGIIVISILFAGKQQNFIYFQF